MLALRTLRRVTSTGWFKKRRYRHLDERAGEAFAAKAMQPAVVARHDFLPLIRSDKVEWRYKRQPDGGRRTVQKVRPIMYPSHRDACILSWYSRLLNERLEIHYASTGLGDCALAYRKTRLGNYHFAAEALAFARDNAPVALLAFDVTGFFDNLDHALLKGRLKWLLSGAIPDDWYRVLRAMMRFSYARLDEMKACPKLEDRFAKGKRDRIATVAEAKAAGVPIHVNPDRKGIPQGTPISAALSNLYMVEFDVAMRAACTARGALYRRYSDDILVVCRLEDAGTLEAEVMDRIREERLEINAGKTERTPFDPTDPTMGQRPLAQYLGFDFGPTGALIRAGSLSRQWQKLRRMQRRLGKVAKAQEKKGEPIKLYTKRYHRRFIRPDLRNFISYGERSAMAFGGSPVMRRQVKRLRREAEAGLARLKAGRPASVKKGPRRK